MGKLTYNTRLVFQGDSDINGAINIGLRSKLPVSCCGNAITYGQANVNSPIVGVGRSQAAIPLG